MDEQNSQNTKASNPVRLEIDYPEQSSRGLAFLTLIWIGKLILLIPHLIAVYFLGIFALAGMIVSQVYVLFKGRYPRSIFELQRGVLQWQNRMNAYMIGLTDQYPPFSFDDRDRDGAMKAIKKLLLVVVILVAIFIVLGLINN